MYRCCEWYETRFIKRIELRRQRDACREDAPLQALDHFRAGEGLPLGYRELWDTLHSAVLLLNVIFA